MKKIITLLILALGLIFSVKTNAISIGEIHNNLSAKNIEEQETFNAIKGMDDKDKLLTSSFYTNTLLVQNLIENSTITITDNIVAGSINYQIKAIMLFTSNKLINYKVSLDDNIFYEFNVVDNEIMFVTLDEIDLCDIYGEYSSNFSLEKNKKITYSQDINEQSLDDKLNNIGFSSIYSILYKPNETYLNEEVCIFTGTKSPYSLEQILSIVSVNDDTDGVIKDFEIDCNTYILDENNYISAGEYKFRIIARDSSGNISFQWVNVMVVDNLAPTMDYRDVTMKYYELLTEEELLESMNIKDDSGIESAYVASDYSDLGRDRPDTYETLICVTDTWGNYTEHNIDVIVIDDLSPVLIKQNDYISTYPYNKLTDDEIKELIYAVDDLEGRIPNYQITYEDLDDYANNYNKLGSYRIKLTATDMFDNYVEATVTIHVQDKDYPKIDLGGYEIIVPANVQLTKEKLKEYLSESNKITITDNVSLESEYFTTENPIGTYDLYIINEDGTIIETKISVLQEAPITPLKLNSNKFNPLPIIITIIALISISGIVILGVFSYKKRH